LINFRRIDRFYLSGGWNNLPENISLLRQNRIKAVLDLQFTPDAGMYANYGPAIEAIKSKLAEDSIAYHAIRMTDDEFNLDFDGILNEGHEILTGWEEKFKPEPRVQQSGKKKVIQMSPPIAGILVKCGAGISRSPTMLINHLCITDRLSYLEALNYLRKKEYDQAVQFGSSPNYYFAEQLKRKYP